MKPRLVLLTALAAVVSTVGLGVAIDAAGRQVAVVAAVTALAAMVASYAWTAVLSFRLFGQDDARDRLRRWARVHLAIIATAPLVLLAAHPWGPATLALGMGVWVVGHFLYMQSVLITGLVRRRRAGATPQG
jgi:putative flippase GtrA